MIRDGDHDDIGAEKLRGLLKILPELDELEMLRAFDGDKTKLGNAEKFLLQLIDIPKWAINCTFNLRCFFFFATILVHNTNGFLRIFISSYKLRIESMLLKEEFASNMSYLEPSINSMIVAGEGKKTN